MSLHELELLANAKVLDKIDTLEKKIASLESRLNTSENQQDEGWMTLKLAASKIGLSAAALSQRIRTELYPEGTVWRKSGEGKTSPIFVNLRELRAYLVQ